jgi:hypothetical protein
MTKDMMNEASKGHQQSLSVTVDVRKKKLVISNRDLRLKAKVPVSR